MFNDLRVVGRSSHKLTDILILSVLAVKCEADNYDTMELFGEAHHEELGCQEHPDDSDGGRGDDVQPRASFGRGHGREQVAWADRGQALPRVRSRCHHKDVPPGLDGVEVRC